MLLGFFLCKSQTSFYNFPKMKIALGATFSPQSKKFSRCAKMTAKVSAIWKKFCLFCQLLIPNDIPVVHSNLRNFYLFMPHPTTTYLILESFCRMMLRRSMILGSDSGVRITMAAVRKNDSLLQLSRNAAWKGESVDICSRMSTAVLINACTRYHVAMVTICPKFKF